MLTHSMMFMDPIGIRKGERTMTNEEMKAQARATRLIVNVDGYKVSFAGSNEVTLYQLQYAAHAIFQGMVKNAAKSGIDEMDALHALNAAIKASSAALMEQWKEEYYAEDHD